LSDYKVYYGEYTLKYWINMIIHREIVLPDYQRNFVWSEQKVIKFIQSLSDEQFVPPVTIGTYTKDGQHYHYILDGQQRLSSLLLTWLGVYPNSGKEFSGDGEIDFADNDDNNEAEESAPNVKKWSIKAIQDGIEDEYTKDGILSKINATKAYHSIDCSQLKLSNSFWDNKILGFAYIKPLQEDSEKQSEYYSSLFRNINISSVPLTPLESRSSLYWLKPGLEEFFQPFFFNDVRVNKTRKLDFIKYLALVSQYIKVNDTSKITSIARGYSGKRGAKTFEDYLENYIYHVIGNKDGATFSKLMDDWQVRMENTIKTYKDLEINMDFPSIRNADSYIFGLVYWTLFKGRDIDTTKKDDLKKAIDDYINKMDDSHKVHPEQLQYLRNRIRNSIDIYEKSLKS